MAISTSLPSSFLAITYYFSIFATSNLSPPNLPCLAKCGDVEITYPFGIGKGCFHPGFEVNCTQSIPFLARSNLQLIEILLTEVRINSTPFIVKSYWYTEYFGHVLSKLPKRSPYTFPANSNKFILVGCNASGSISDGMIAINTCTSICPQREKVVNGSCSGYGCCQVDVPSIKNSLNISIVDAQEETNSTIFTSFSYRFVVEDGSYIFTASDLSDFHPNIHMKFEWAIGKKNCDQVKKSNSSVCGENSDCVDSKRSSGYLCRCADGYIGNPYLNGPGGCQDLDECEPLFFLSYPCVPGAICENRVPGYLCHCPAGTSGNGFRYGIGCHKNFPMREIVIATVLTAGLLTPCLYLIKLALKKRDLKNLNAKYFRQNGGLLLQQYFSPSKGTAIKHIKIFSACELKKATSNYDRSRILGSGGQGTVFMGTQEDGSIIAVKRPEEVAHGQVDQFINELIILSQIDHKNIVKLLGCCLETQVPLLIYEFISGGTLYQKLHDDPNLTTQSSWKDRLRIALEIADALSYLHSCVSMPIFHRDVKSSNILLDENFTVKLADFGVSRLIPIDKIRVSTTVKGTIGYLDPEYFKTGKLTEKSDVYSFGVVLLELLSGRKAVQHEQTRDYGSLVIHFLLYFEEGNLLEVLDEGIVREAKMEDLLAIAEIARRCLSLKGEKRPTMKEVAQKLECFGQSYVTFRSM